MAGQRQPTLGEMQSFADELVQFDPKLAGLKGFLANGGSYSARYVELLHGLSTNLGSIGHPDTFRLQTGINILIKHMRTRAQIYASLDSKPIFPEANTVNEMPKEVLEGIQKLHDFYLGEIRRARSSGRDPLNHLDYFVKELRSEDQVLIYGLFFDLAGGTPESPRVLPKDLVVLAHVVKALGLSDTDQGWMKRVRTVCPTRWTQLLTNCSFGLSSNMTGGTLAIPPQARQQPNPSFDGKLTILASPSDPVHPGRSGTIPPQYSLGQQGALPPAYNAEANPATGAPLPFAAVPSSGYFPNPPQPVSGSQQGAASNLAAFPSPAIQPGFNAVPISDEPSWAQVPFQDQGAFAIPPTEDLHESQSPDLKEVTVMTEKDIFDELEHKYNVKIAVKIGQGGMGEVFRAEQLKLGRDVCVKSIISATAEAMIRFEREIKAAAALYEKNVPGIAAHHGVHTIEGNMYLVFELFKGQDKFHINPESIQAALFRSQGREQFDNLNTYSRELAQFIGNETESVPLSSIVQLLRYYAYIANKRGDDELKKKLEPINREVQGVSAQNGHISRVYADSTDYLMDALTKLKKLVDTQSLFGTPAAHCDNPEADHNRKGASLAHYLSLVGLSGIDKPLDGSDARLLFQVMRDVSGDDFPEDELYELLGHLELDQKITLREVHKNGVLHRDLKPDNTMIDPLGSGTLVCVTNQILFFAGTTPNSPDRKAVLIEPVLTAISDLKKARAAQVQKSHLVYTIDFGLVLPPDEEAREEMRRMSTSGQHPLPQQDPRLTIEGTIMGTPQYMSPLTTSPPEGYTEDHYADFHADKLTWLEIFKGQAVGVVGQGAFFTVLLARAQLSEAADMAREYMGWAPDACGRPVVPITVFDGKDGCLATLKTLQVKSFQDGDLGIEVPLSRVDCEPELVAFLERTHPRYLKMSQRATYMGLVPNNFPKITWDEQVDYLKDWLDPDVEQVVQQEVKEIVTKKSRRIGLIAAAVVAAVCALGSGAWYLRDEHNRKKEITEISLRINETDSEKTNLRDARFTSAYFRDRMADIERFRTLKGSDLTDDESSELKDKEKFFRLLMLKMLFSEAANEYYRFGRERRNGDQGQEVFNNARPHLEKAVVYFLECEFQIEGEMEAAQFIDDSLIDSPCTRRDIIAKGRELGTMSDKDRALRLSAEIALRTLTHNQDNHFSMIEDNSLNNVFKRTEFAIVEFFVGRATARTRLNGDSVNGYPLERKILILRALEKSMAYLYDLYKKVHLDKMDIDDVYRIRAEESLGSCLNAYLEILVMTENHSESLKTTR
jgi:serine/threonine protein kinase